MLAQLGPQLPAQPVSRFHFTAHEPFAIKVPPTVQPHEPTVQLEFAYEPLSEPFEQLRVCDVQLLPHGTLAAEYAVTLPPWAIEPPQGRLQPEQLCAGQLALL